MSPEQNRKLFLIIAIAAIAFNLRPPISSVGPLISEIRTDTGLSNTLLGMLTTLPILMFGLLSVFTPLFTRHLGTEGTMTMALLILTAGTLLRVVPGGEVGQFTNGAIDVNTPNVRGIQPITCFRTDTLRFTLFDGRMNT